MKLDDVYKKRTFVFMSLPLHSLSMAETVELVKTSLTKKQKIQHMCVSVSKLVKAQDDKVLRDSIIGSDLINIDGMGIVWGARLLGHKVPERVAGIDLMHNILAMCAKEGFKPYIWGAKEDVLQAALKNLKTSYPALKIAGARNGYFKPEDEQKIINDINTSNADCLFVAISSPTKERLSAEYRNTLNPSFIMGVGGSIDVAAGLVRRAPVWMQKAGMEWLYRVLQEPRRLFARYFLTNGRFALLLGRELFARLFSRLFGWRRGHHSE